MCAPRFSPRKVLGTCTHMCRCACVCDWIPRVRVIEKRLSVSTRYEIYNSTFPFLSLRDLLSFGKWTKERSAAWNTGQPQCSSRHLEVFVLTAILIVDVRHFPVSFPTLGRLTYPKKYSVKQMGDSGLFEITFISWLICDCTAALNHLEFPSVFETLYNFL